MKFILAQVGIIFIGMIIESTFGWMKYLIEKFKYSTNLKRFDENTKIIQDSHLVEVLSGDFKSYDASSITLTELDQHFYISFPDEKIEKFRSKFDKNPDALKNFENSFLIFPDTGFHGANDFKKMCADTKINNLEEELELARLEVADEFISRKDGNYFNNRKYGIYEVDYLNKQGEEEDRLLHLSLFHTDYFTFKVTQKVYRKLFSKDKSIAENITQEKLKRLNLFLTSFGVSSLVHLDDPKLGPLCIFTERAKTASDTDKSGIYHMTMNEGLNQMDKGNQDQIVRVSNCLERGFYEELGITNNHFTEGVKSSFYDFFLVKDTFQLGLSALTEINTFDFKTFKELASVAPDSVLEVKSLKPILLQKKTIENFFKTKDFIPFSKAMIPRLIARKGIFIDIEKIYKNI